MLALSIGIYMFAVAGGVTAPYFFEDDPKHHRVQFAAALTKANELLWVTKQTKGSNLISAALCQGMKKSRHIHGNQFRYDLFFAPSTTATGALRKFSTILTTAKTTSHHFENAVSYQAPKGGLPVLYKLLFADFEKRCYILVVTDKKRNRACRLLRANIVLDQPVPLDCERVYRTQCPSQSTQVYLPLCRNVFAINYGRKS